MKVANYTFLLLLICCAPACKLDPPIFPTTATTGGTTPVSNTATYYFKGTLGGQDADWEVTNTNSAYITGSLGNVTYSEGLITGSLLASISADNDAAQPGISIEFRTYQVDDAGYIAYFNNFVTTGAWAYATTNDFTPGTKALAIYYVDSNGKQYSSIGTQTGSSANIIAITQIAKTAALPESLKIKLTFNCTLYPVDGTGDNITLTNAQATILLTDHLV